MSGGMLPDFDQVFQDAGDGKLLKGEFAERFLTYGLIEFSTSYPVRSASSFQFCCILFSLELI